jgi:adenine-specific DNA-methyltransferase
MPTLNWLTREADLQKSRRAPYRLLEPVPEMGYGDPAAGNLLIQGDNLDALKALLPYYAGTVRPPRGGGNQLPVRFRLPERQLSRSLAV